MGAREILVPYDPRPLQDDYHDKRTRFSVMVCHRRFGKTVMLVNEAIASVLECEQPRPRVAYCAPTYNQAKRIAWDYVKHFAGVIPGISFNEAELRADFPNGGRLQLLGQDNPDSLRGSYYDDFFADEFQMWSPRVFPEIIRPALADRKGRATFSGTPAGTENPLHEIWQAGQKDGWYCKIHRASETSYVAQEELDAAAKVMSQEQYAQEFECSWTSAIIGSIYGRLLDEMEKGGRIRSLPYDVTVPTDISFDLGRGDATAMWFIQRVGPEIRLVDHYENAGPDITHYERIIEERRKVYDFKVGTLILPHDAEHRHMTGESVATTLRGLRYNVHVCPKGDPEREIHAVRVMLKTTWLDPERCAFGYKCLRNYRHAYNEERKTFYERPHHDWTSHSADALRIFAVNRDRIVNAGSSWSAIEYSNRNVI